MGSNFTAQRHGCILDGVNKHLKDILGIIGFIVIVLIGSFAINSFLFRSFDVKGPSMEDTLHTGDRVVVNRLHHTKSLITGKPYTPQRGQIIVFSNPLLHQPGHDEFIVKRVIGLPGERVVVKNGQLSVYLNSPAPAIIHPDQAHPGPKSPTSGDVDVVVPKDHLFVAGDNRIDSYSLDSRNGLGMVPLINVQGPVVMRVFPFNQIKQF